MADINQMCHAYSTDSMPRPMTSGQFELLVRLECIYKIKVNWDFDFLLHVASDKITAIRDAVKSGLVQKRTTPKDYDLHYKHLCDTLIPDTYPEEDVSQCPHCGYVDCICHFLQKEEEEESGHICPICGLFCCPHEY